MALNTRQIYGTITAGTPFSGECFPGKSASGGKTLWRDTVLDTFVEQIVAKRKSGKEYAVIFGSLIAALLILAALWLFLLFYIGIFFVLILTAGIGWLLWYLITMQNVEFEYSVTNGDIDIDQITAQRKRKRIVSVSGEKIETFAPYNAAEYTNRHFDRTVMAATSPDAQGVWCFTYHSKKNGNTLVIFEPEDRVINALKGGLSKLLQLDINRKLGTRAATPATSHGTDEPEE